MAKIIVCDDDKKFADVIAGFLTGKGHQVVHALEVDDLRLLTSGGSPDLLILDMQMGGGGGPAAAALGGAPIIVCSGMPVEAQKKWFPKAERMRFLQKPVKFEELEAAVKELLGS